MSEHEPTYCARCNSRISEDSALVLRVFIQHWEGEGDVPVYEMVCLGCYAKSDPSEQPPAAEDTTDGQ